MLSCAVSLRYPSPEYSTNKALGPSMNLDLAMGECYFKDSRIVTARDAARSVCAALVSVIHVLDQVGVKKRGELLVIACVTGVPSVSAAGRCVWFALTGASCTLFVLYL